MINPRKLATMQQDDVMCMTKMPPESIRILQLAQKLAMRSLSKQQQQQQQQQQVTLDDVERAVLGCINSSTCVEFTIGELDLLSDNNDTGNDSEKMIDVDDLFFQSEFLNPPSHEVSIYVQWLCVDGHVLPFFKGGSIADTKRAEKQQIRKEKALRERHVYEQVDVDTVYHSGFSKEHKAYWDHIKASLVHSDIPIHQAALDVMKTSTIVGQLMPYLSKWIEEQIHSALGCQDYVRMQLCVDVVMSLVSNPLVDFAPFLTQYIPVLISIAVCDYTNNTSNKQDTTAKQDNNNSNAVKTASSIALAAICKKQQTDDRILESQVLSQLVGILQNASCSIETQVGALICMSAFAMQLQNRVVRTVLEQKIIEWASNPQAANGIRCIRELLTFCPIL